jgi:hypothetical protein
MRDGVIDKHGAGQVDRRKEIEVRGQAKMIDDRSRDQPANKVAGHIAGDVSSKCTVGVHVAALFAKIGEGQRECRSHAKALHDAQRGKNHEVWSCCEQRGRNREQYKAHENAAPAIDVAAEQRHDEA